MTLAGMGWYKTFLGQDREPGPSRSESSGNHFANFVEAVRSRDESILNAPVIHAHQSSGLAHLGNIAYRVGRVLEFDPASESFVGDEEADRLLRRQDRAPFIVPEKV